MTTRVLRDRAVIRSARTEDRDFLFRLSTDVFARYSRDPVAMMRALMQHGAGILVAEHGLNGKPVRLGFAAIELSAPQPAVAGFEAPRLAHLSAIAVRPEAMGCGLGRELLEASENFAREHGAIAMSLLTAKTNVVAQGLFRSAGYTDILGIADAYADDQAGIRMLKSLSL